MGQERNWTAATCRRCESADMSAHSKPGKLGRYRISGRSLWTIRVITLAWTMSSYLALAGEIALPPRPADAPKGVAFAGRIAALDLASRESEIISEVSRGNVPEFWRHFVPVTVTRKVDGQDMTAVYEVSPDYLAIGADDDYLLIPVSPGTAQALADKVDCVLPTTRMVDDIYAAAAVKLSPAPIPPSPEMTNVNDISAAQTEMVGQSAGPRFWRRIRWVRSSPGTRKTSSSPAGFPPRRARSPFTAGSVWTARRSSRFTPGTPRRGWITVRARGWSGRA